MSSKAFANSFSVSEIDAFLELSNEGVAARDKIIVALIKTRWDVDRARELLRDEKKDDLKATRRSMPAQSSIMCICGRPVNKYGTQCCTHCPASHTRDCNARCKVPEADATGTSGCMDRGYLVLRTPPALEAQRGLHRCTWSTLMTRLPGLESTTRSKFYIRRASTEDENQKWWRDAGLLGDPPDHETGVREEKG